MSNNLNISSSEWKVILEQANMLVKTGFLPASIKTPEQALAIILLGKELGIGTMQSFQGINVIQGKPTIAPQLMLALIHQSGNLDGLEMGDDPVNKVYTVTMKRKGLKPHTETFSMEDAKKLNLMNKPNWINQPATMRKWRCVAACARVVFPDVTLGFYTPDEIDPETAAAPEEQQLIAPKGGGTVAIMGAPSSVGVGTQVQAAVEDPAIKLELIKKIQALYAKETKLGGQTPADELNLDLKTYTEAQLRTLGKVVQARVAGLEPKK